jgi:hypothetical protein
MTLLISTVGKSRGWISQDSLCVGPPRWLPFSSRTCQTFRRKVSIYQKARMIVGFSGLALRTVPIARMAAWYANFDALVSHLPMMWGRRRPHDYCQIVVVGWSAARDRVMGYEIYAAPDAEPTFDHVEIGTKLDDDLDPAGLHYREIRKLAGFCEPDPTAAAVERLHRLVATNIIDASRCGHYGRPFAGGAVDFATVTRDGVEVRQLDMAPADAA